MVDDRWPDHRRQPDGVIRECSADTEPDLFWACRGGGSFGVVTAFTFGTHAAPDLVLFFLRWPWSVAEQVVSAWQRWAPSAPDELWSNMHLFGAPGGALPQISVGGTYAGGTAQAQELLDRLYEAVGSQPSSAFVQSEQYLTAMLVEAGCASMSVAQCHLAPGAAGAVAFDAFGGAINRVGASDTAFVHRDTLFLAQYSTTWAAQPGAPDAGAGTAAVGRQRAWLASFHAAMRPYASGQAYQNYADPDLADWQRAYYGANYPRLQRIKAAVDPANLFRFPQSIELPA